MYIYIQAIIITDLTEDVDPRTTENYHSLSLELLLGIWKKKIGAYCGDRGRAFLRRVFVPLRLSLTSVTRFRPVKLKADGAGHTANRNLLSRFREPKSGKGHLAARKCVVPTTTRGQMVHQ